MKTTRRNFFQTMGAGAAGIGLTAIPLVSCASNKANTQNPQDDEQQLQIGDNIAIADTKYGKVKGFILRGIYNYRGIPYGADTSGANRFMPPQPPKSWDNTLPAVWWGNTAPQIMDNRYANPYSSFVDHWNYDDVSEDCLKLNIWTQGIADGKKRPVLVWFHGGGFTNGNGLEQDSYDGENLCRKGDVVFCSVNHRLGPIGFSDLSAAGGEKYASSGNVGVLDLIAALEWVRDNIANFGGDPGNVTIMGQSGGGAKVCTVTAMPASKGLIHKSVALSGNIVGGVPKEYSSKLGTYILKEAGLNPGEVDKLQQIPWKEYIQIAAKADAKLIKETGGSGMMRGSFGPVADGVHLPKERFFSDNSSYSASVPMILSSTFNEMSPSRTDAKLENITMAEVVEKLKLPTPTSAGMGEKANAIVEAYSKAFPSAKPIEIWSMISSNRTRVIETAEAKVIQPAQVYLAWFGWQPPLFDNRMRAFHCLDISFWFANTDQMLTHTGGGKRPRLLADKMSDALLQFMRTGNPNCQSLPKWRAYSSANGETMILDDVCELKNDLDREARKLL